MDQFFTNQVFFFKVQLQQVLASFTANRAFLASFTANRASDLTKHGKINSRKLVLLCINFRNKEFLTLKKHCVILKHLENTLIN